MVKPKLPYVFKRGRVYHVAESLSYVKAAEEALVLEVRTERHRSAEFACGSDGMGR